MRINVRAWQRFADTLDRPWLRTFAIIDLACHEALSRDRGILFPEETELSARWGWEPEKVVELVEDRDAWAAVEAD